MKRFCSLFLVLMVFAAPCRAAEIVASKYGAIPDDGLDDTAGLNQAFSACSKNGDRLLVPPGIYLVTGPLDWQSSVVVHVAASPQAIFDVRFAPGAAGSVITWGAKDGTPRLTFGRFDGPTIRHQGPGGKKWDDDLTALTVRNVAEAEVRWGDIRDFRTGLRLRADGLNGLVAYSTFHKSKISGCKEALALSTDGTGWANRLTFQSIFFGGPALYTDEGTAVAPFTVSTVRLAPSAPGPGTTDALKGYSVLLKSGTGEGQKRLIVSYTDTRIATVSPDWTTVPDGKTTYSILPRPAPYDAAAFIVLPKVPRSPPSGWVFRDCNFEIGDATNMVLLQGSNLQWSTFDQCWFEATKGRLKIKMDPWLDYFQRVVVRGGVPFSVDWDSRILVVP